jgi:hypothetical protein
MHLTAPKVAPPRLSPEQERLGLGWNHILQGGSVIKAQAIPTPTPTSFGLGK